MGMQALLVLQWFKAGAYPPCPRRKFTRPERKILICEEYMSKKRAGLKPKLMKSFCKYSVF